MPFDGTLANKPSLLDQIKGVFGRKAPAPVLFAPLDDQTVQVLTIGRALIAERKDWVQRRYETRDGRRCAVGALRGAAKLMNLQGPQTGANTMLVSVAMSRGFKDIESLNDNSSHRQVISAFDEAISRAKFSCEMGI